MATLIPDPPRATAHSAERALAQILRRLPEDWTVYHEPGIPNQRGHVLRPDFVVLAPEHGVLVIEVKDWRLSSVQAVDHDHVTLRPSGKTADQRERTPLRQVDSYWHAINEACSHDLFGQTLVQKVGPYAGKLCFPIGTLVLFNNISRADLAKSELRAAWEKIFTPQTTALADDRRAWEDLGELELAVALRPYFRPFAMRERFTAHQIDVLRWVLFPESRMDVILNREGADSEKVMAVLDARQEQHARSLGSGHRILFGVAGSGKTVLLLARARWIAREHPGRRTLILCFNKVLAAWLAARISDCPGVTVRHFDGWAKDQHVSRHWQETDEAFGRRFLTALQQKGDSAREFDTVLVDEAQDFDPTWFQCVLAGHRDPVEGDLVIVADGSQRLYKRGKLSWKALGIRAAGRTVSARYDLDKNYRNTPRIAALAAPFTADERDEDGIAGRRVEPNACRRVNVSLPTFVETTTPEAQVDAALEIVGRWLSGRHSTGCKPPLRPQDIGLLYPRQSAEPLVEKLVAGLCQLAPTRWLSKAKDKTAHLSVNDAAIKVQTIHAAKGLQYRALIVLWTEDLPRERQELEGERRLLYVALTRAENDLVLMGSRPTGFAAELRRECAVRQFPFAPVAALA